MRCLWIYNKNFESNKQLDNYVKISHGFDWLYCSLVRVYTRNSSVFYISIRRNSRVFYISIRYTRNSRVFYSSTKLSEHINFQYNLPKHIFDYEDL